MANWSRTMWQSVVNRAVRILASGPFGSNFASASAVVSGNLITASPTGKTSSVAMCEKVATRDRLVEASAFTAADAVID
ncbi:hypothetical protein KIN20_031938 [Parelaphostrongylus tenuis]|uniref:Uncharacterized protein n=1 Tax=Parelaphostrongylus tenuis TaxID=148309 RepID=A0AAD5R662_PARTN|nr:hypothetical protein KIN20_031938 [Parelaphostrongylus tenuis]